MNDLMKELLGKFTRYDWFTTLLPGFFFVELANRIGFKLTSGLWYRDFMLSFLCGLICSRIGATIVEWIARRKCFGLFEEYCDYLDWRAANPHDADILITNSNWFRSLTGMVVTVIGLWGCQLLFEVLYVSLVVKKIVALLFLLFLFADSYRRQLVYTTKRIRKSKGNKALEE